MKTCKMLPAEIILHQAVLRNAAEFQQSYFRGTKERNHPCPECSIWGMLQSTPPFPPTLTGTLMPACGSRSRFSLGNKTSWFYLITHQLLSNQCTQFCFQKTSSEIPKPHIDISKITSRLATLGWIRISACFLAWRDTRVYLIFG